MHTSPSVDALGQPVRAATSRFEIAARRLIDGWLDAGAMRCSADDLALAAEFLARCGLRAKAMPGLAVELTSESGRTSITSRERVFIMALRCLATLEAQHAASPPVPRAA